MLLTWCEVDDMLLTCCEVDDRSLTCCEVDDISKRQEMNTVLVKCRLTDSCIRAVVDMFL